MTGGPTLGPCVNVCSAMAESAALPMPMPESDTSLGTAPEAAHERSEWCRTVVTETRRMGIGRLTGLASKEECRFADVIGLR